MAQAVTLTPVDLSTEVQLLVDVFKDQVITPTSGIASGESFGTVILPAESKFPVGFLPI